MTTTNMETTIIPLVTDEQKQAEEIWRKSIPAQVFLNYFFAINYHIQEADDAMGGLQHLPYFRAHQAELTDADVQAVTKLLHASWSTEYALRATAELGDEDYLRNALHWTFPQAYHTIMAGLQAFLYTAGVRSSNPSLIRREVGRLVVRNAYPRPISFYAAGAYGDFSIHRLPLAGYKAGLHIAGKEIDAQAQIGQFLRTTRKLKAQATRQQVQANPNTALRSQKTGKVLDKWTAAHWQQITWRLGYTTIFDLLGRLRISQTSREIERFVEAEIDFKLFHQSLLNIVSYLNGIHETYVAKAMGVERYQQLVAELPKHLQNSFVQERLQTRVEPMLRDDEPTMRMAA
ncbi:hypothetical protein MUN84_16925 [Hymenobacter sp. 5516J-16]|uniref:Uncharacterized protein n=1 Tax=Hymenobacter sublimis TaxID=2933777 RepID=A0ABY4JEZ5_9BACT|nr:MULTISPECIES: hypothetical protein [Hymenobacter]UOQ76248.1 hypothetical protein MUN84_16925 [Hymenobacter sp. 5516J-16]UPL49919.1 hypothetical protein MWH26_03155 [Hymenobacter sublimis]